MTNKNYGRAFINAIQETDNSAGGKAVTILGAFNSAEGNFSDEENLKVIATYAIKTADALFSLVHEKCDIDNPLAEKNQNIEMYISMSVLACEVYMKAMLYFHNRHNGKKIKKHELDYLFGKLSDDEKERLIDKVPGIKEKISNISKAFEELRYVFELNAFNKEYLLVFDLMDALHDMCSELPKHEMGVLKYSSGIIRLE